MKKKRNVLSENWTEMRNKPVTPNMGHVGHADRITGLDHDDDGPLKKKYCYMNTFVKYGFQKINKKGNVFTCL